MEGEVFGAILIAVLVVVLVFLMFRAFWNWYFKISERLNELKQQTKLLNDIKILLSNNSITPNDSPTGQDGFAPQNAICKNCGNPIQEGTLFCTKCGTEFNK